MKKTTILLVIIALFGLSETGAKAQGIKNVNAVYGFVEKALNSKKAPKTHLDSAMEQVGIRLEPRDGFAMIFFLPSNFGWREHCRITGASMEKNNYIAIEGLDLSKTKEEKGVIYFYRYGNLKPDQALIVYQISVEKAITEVFSKSTDYHIYPLAVGMATVSK